MTNHKDITSPPLIMASFRRDSTLILTTAPAHRNIDYTPYLGTVKDALKELKPNTAPLTSQMTKFLIHEIPTFYTPEEIRQDIENTNPTVKVTETPRWLTSPEKRAGKQVSTMIIAICGSATLKGLGDSVIVASKRCSVETYLTFGPSTQCNYCEGYSHPTVKFPVQKDHSPPTCAVCAERHATELHSAPSVTANKVSSAHTLRLNVLAAVHPINQLIWNAQPKSKSRQTSKQNGKLLNLLKAWGELPERRPKPIKEWQPCTDTELCKR
jgi:hypothetical protein